MADNIASSDSGKEQILTPLSPVLSSDSLIDKAEKLARRIEEANIKTEELLKQQEALAARLALSGRSEAGQIPRAAPPMSDIEFANKVMKGEINPLTL